MKKAILMAVLALAVVGVSLSWALLPMAETETTEAAVQPTEELAQLFPTLNHSEAWFTGTWCYISCSDGTGSSVRSFSTSGCCNACASACGTVCVANGGGPSVLCGDV